MRRGGVRVVGMSAQTSSSMMKAFAQWIKKILTGKRGPPRVLILAHAPQLAACARIRKKLPVPKSNWLRWVDFCATLAVGKNGQHGGLTADRKNAF